MSPASLGSDHQDEDLITEINVTPMVDIMLVLLIIFMVTASFIVRPSIEVKLPRASTGKQVVTTLGVTLRADGGLLLNGRPVGERELLERLREGVRKEKLQAIIAGDDAVRHGRVVRVIDILRRAGVTQFAINVKVDESYLDDLER
jgi:biopolymer transport protein ExbD